VHTQQGTTAGKLSIGAVRYHEAVWAAFFRSSCGTNRSFAPYRKHSKRRETNMKITKTILASAMVVALASSGALAQQALTGAITKLDEANGKITIQQTQSGTVGANTAGAGEDFKVQDGLIFNAFQVGDKVVFTATDVGGVKTITKLEKQ
jgi:Cu/Ag efflux protein CusF